MPDYTVGDTVYKRFTTRAFATGIPTTLAGTPVVSAYEDDSAIQITAGITLGVDHDTVTGLNLLTIVASGANGFEAGKSYDLVITTGTVGGVSVVGEVVWHFTLSAEAAAVDLANGTDGLGAIKADTAAVLTDTGTTLPATLSTIDTNVDAILVDTGTTLPATLATAANLATVDSNVDAILVDTGTTLPASIATIDTNVDAILVDTGTTIPGLIAALNDITVADVLTTQMTQSYAADGTAPTLAQALFAIQQFLQERAVAGTTVTVKQLDGSTTAMTFTLDDGTSPTSITRAT